MPRIERSVDLPGPPEEVFALLTDLERLPEWATIVVETRDVSEVPLRPGCTFRQTVRVLGHDIESEWRVVALEAPRLVSYEASSPTGARLAMTQRVEPSNGGSRVDLELDYELPGGVIGAAIDRLYFERHNEEEAERSLANLRSLLEQDRAGRPTGAA